MTEELPELVKKKYLLIKALSSGWHTIDKLEELSGLSRSQIFRSFKKLKSEFAMEIYNQVKEGDVVMIYRITNMGIINPERFDLLMLSIEAN